MSNGNEYKLKDYQKAFCPYNASATNKYMKKQNLVYLVSIHHNPIIIRWFKGHIVDIDDDDLALSQMLQWVFRSAIRKKDGGNINLLIMSKRMRRLFETWLGSDSIS